MTALNDHRLELRVLATLADVSMVDLGDAKSAAERSQLTSEDFHTPLHQKVWGAQMLLLHEGEAADFYRVSTRLGRDEQAKMPGLISEATTSGSLLLSSAIFGAAADLRGMTLRRNIVRLGRELMEQASRVDSPAALLSNTTALLHRITSSRAANWRTLHEVIVGQMRMEMAAVASGKSPVIPTGFAEWDRLIGGLWPTLIIIGAHPGHGKSAFIGRLLMNLGLRGIRTAVFSLEDPATWVAYRALSSASGITQLVLRSRVLTPEQADALHHAEQAAYAFSQNILIDDRGALGPEEIVQSGRDAILNRGAQVLVVDHLGEVRHGEGDRHDLRIQESLSNVRELAKGYGVPVVMAAHLKPGATPPYTQHDFRNAFAIEAMARVLVAWEKKDDTLNVQVLKNQFGLGSASFTLPFHGSSGLVGVDPPPVAKQGDLL